MIVCIGNAVLPIVKVALTATDMLDNILEKNESNVTVQFLFIFY